jgi:hypothetical protein
MKPPSALGSRIPAPPAGYNREVVARYSNAPPTDEEWREVCRYLEQDWLEAMQKGLPRYLSEAEVCYLHGYDALWQR